MEVFMELPGGVQHLVPRVNQLKEVGPGVVQRVLPLGDGGGVCVSHRDQRVGDLVDGGHALCADALGLLGELLEALDEQRDVLVVLAQLVATGHHLEIVR